MNKTVDNITMESQKLIRYMENCKLTLPEQAAALKSAAAVLEHAHQVETLKVAMYNAFNQIKG
ncbi:MAG: hypothetical protein K0U41_02350 [Gammaproteobacteria bacterium]|nr:hypothetical protein [Gammaproteobacteria bacterium]